METRVENQDNSFQFTIDKKDHIIELQAEGISWKLASKKGAKVSSIKYKDVFSVELEKLNDGKTAVIIHCANKKSSPKWTHQQVKCITADRSAPESLMSSIQEKLRTFETRPRSCLVFVNPDGGAKKGLKIWTDKVEPLFRLAGVTFDVVVTKDGNHAGEVISTYDLSRVDSLISVGGDGTFRQVLNGLMSRTAQDQGKNVDDPDTEWTTPRQWVGVIPSGTGQGVIMTLSGTFDVTTATLHILLGSKFPFSLFNVYNGGKLLSTAGLLVGYGIYGEMIKYTETHRHLGRARYPIAMCNSLCGSQPTYDLEVSYEQPSHLHGKTNEGVTEDSGCTSDGQSSWITCRGQYKAFNMFALPVPFGLRDPEPLLHAQIIHEGFHRINFLRHLVRYATAAENAMDFNGMQEIVCKSFKFTTGEHHSDILNIDGDPYDLLDNTVYVKILPNILNVFGDGEALEELKRKHASGSHQRAENKV